MQQVRDRLMSRLEEVSSIRWRRDVVAMMAGGRVRVVVKMPSLLREVVVDLCVRPEKRGVLWDFGQGRAVFYIVSLINTIRIVSWLKCLHRRMIHQKVDSHCLQADGWSQLGEGTKRKIWPIRVSSCATLNHKWVGVLKARAALVASAAHQHQAINGSHRWSHLNPPALSW